MSLKYSLLTFGGKDNKQYWLMTQPLTMYSQNGWT